MGLRQSREPEVRGEESASHFILVEYCGGWGYYKHAAAVADRIQAKYAGKFRFELRSDAGTTGRCEVTIFANSKGPAETGGILIHSKANGQGIPSKGWDAFDTRLDEAVAKLWSKVFQKITENDLKSNQ